MEKQESLLEKWKKIEAKEKKDNPFGKFVVDEGEFVEIKSGVQQLDIRELTEEEENGSSNNNSDIPKQ